MADFRRSVLGLFQQGVDAVNSAVTHVSNATRNKMDEIALQNQRKELLEKLANTVYEQWQQGASYPESITDILEQIKAMNEQIDTVARQQEQATDDLLKQMGKSADDFAKQVEKSADSFARHAEKSADELMKQVEKAVADLDVDIEIEVPEEVAKSAETFEAPKAAEDGVPTIKVQEEQAPAWPEQPVTSAPPVAGDVPQIVVPEEPESEE